MMTRMLLLDMALMLAFLSLARLVGAVPVPFDGASLQGGGELTWHYSDDMVTIAGDRYQGAGYIANKDGNRRSGSLTFDVTGKTRFTAAAGLSDEWENDNGAVAIEVDGKLVARTDRKSGQPAVLFDIPLKNAKRLLIRMQVSILLAAPTIYDTTTILRVSTEPAGADIYLNGERQGVSPLDFRYRTNLPPDGLAVTVEARQTDRQAVRRQVTLLPGQLITLNLQLPSALATLAVTTDPPGADIYIDGTKAGVSPLNLVLRDISDYGKTVTLEARKTDYKTVQKMVTLRQGSTTTEQLTLLLLWATLSITTDPPGADVYLDFNKAGVSPLDLRIADIPDLGKTVTLEARKGNELIAKVPILVKQGQHLPVSLRLSGAFIPGTRAAEERTNLRDGAAMVWVPAGAFQMGSADGSPLEQPPHSVELDGYWIYKYEVTVAQYRTFCQATGRPMPPEPAWKWQETHPIVNVTWDDAKAYADWAGMSLPTEAEWEKAARGTDGRKWPWGNVWDPTKCGPYPKGMTATMPVGSFPGDVSPYGTFDMAGSVWEWCLDGFNFRGYQISPARNPVEPPYGPQHVIRGGSWINCPPVQLFFRASSRTNYYAFSLRKPADRYDICGFRCVSRANIVPPGQPIQLGQPGQAVADLLAGKQARLLLSLERNVFNITNAPGNGWVRTAYIDLPDGAYQPTPTAPIPNVQVEFDLVFQRSISHYDSFCFSLFDQGTAPERGNGYDSMLVPPAVTLFYSHARNAMGLNVTGDFRALVQQCAIPCPIAPPMGTPPATVMDDRKIHIALQVEGGKTIRCCISRQDKLITFVEVQKDCTALMLNHKMALYCGSNAQMGVMLGNLKIYSYQ